MAVNLLADKVKTDGALRLKLNALREAETLSRQEFILERCSKRELQQIYAKYLNQLPKKSMNKTELVRSIMRAVECNTPGIIDFDVKQRILEAKSKADRIAVLEHCTRQALINFAYWKHESLNNEPVVIFTYDSRRSIEAKCIARLSFLFKESV